LSLLLPSAVANGLNSPRLPMRSLASGASESRAVDELVQNMWPAKP
jgi:hypothetical protein